MRIAFASGKGGTGKTTLATNLTAWLADQGETVCYADCDVEEPNGHIFLKPEIEDTIDVTVPIPVIDAEACDACGECVTHCQFNAIALLGKTVAVFPTLCHSCGVCSAICPQQAITESSRSLGTITIGRGRGAGVYTGRLTVGEALAPPVSRALKSLLPDDGTIIIDAPPGTSCPVIEAVTGCDYLVLVTEPTPCGLHDLCLALEMAGKLHLPCGVVINNDDGDPDTEVAIASRGAEILQTIAYQPHLARKYSEGHMLIDADPGYAWKMKHLYGKITRAVAHG